MANLLRLLGHYTLIRVRLSRWFVRILVASTCDHYWWLVPVTMPLIATLTRISILGLTTVLNIILPEHIQLVSGKAI